MESLHTTLEKYIALEILKNKNLIFKQTKLNLIGTMQQMQCTSIYHSTMEVSSCNLTLFSWIGWMFTISDLLGMRLRFQFQIPILL